MKEVKYIPLDLVKADKNPNIIWKVKDVSQDKRGNVLYRVVAAEDNDAFIYLYEHQIASVPLTPEILEKNGWKTQNGWFYYLYVRKGFISCIDIDFQHKSGRGKLLVKSNNDSLLEIEYVHQLQHLLFGLGLNHEMDV